MPKKEKKVKVTEKIGNITYLASDNDENKPKRFVSLATRKKLSDKRRSLTKQPREGQSKKASNLYAQLDKDYIKQNSAKGQFMKGKSKESLKDDEFNIFSLNNENGMDSGFIEEEVDEKLDEVTEVKVKKKSKKTKKLKKGKKIKLVEEPVEEIVKAEATPFKLFIAITPKHRAEIKKWLDKNKDELSKVTAKDGIINEYDIQKVNFSQIKMTESLLINIEQKNSNIDSEDIYWLENLNDEFIEKERDEVIQYLISNKYSFEEIFTYVQKELMVEMLEKRSVAELEIEKVISKYEPRLIQIYDYVSKILRKIGRRENIKSILMEVIRYSFLLSHYDQNMEELIKDYIEEKYEDLVEFIIPSQLSFLKG